MPEPPSPTPTAAPTSTPAPTAAPTPTPTPTAVPTLTPTPTAIPTTTPTPTAAPTSTPTPTPSPTPTPTATPTPTPTPTLAPFGVYSFSVGENYSNESVFLETPYSKSLRINIYRAFKDVTIEPPSEVMTFIQENVVALENLMALPILEESSDFNVYVEPFFYEKSKWSGYYQSDEMFIGENLYAYTANLSPQTFRRDTVIVHELAHFYWNGGEHASISWMTEGVPEWIAWRLSPWPTEAHSYWREWRPECQGVNLESMPDPCKYDQGRRLFTDLSKNLGEEAFLQGLRNLYAILGEARHDGDSLSYEEAIALMKQAFPESVHHRIDRY